LWPKYCKVKKKYENYLKDRTRVNVPRKKHVTSTSSFVDDSENCWWTGNSDLDVFPRKKNVGTRKVNVFFSDVWKDALTYHKRVAGVFGHHVALSAGMYNDQASSWLVWLVASFSHLGASAFAICEMFSGREKCLKGLNTYGKSIGVQQHEWGRDVCELTTMAGRGVAPVDAVADVRTRVDVDAFLTEKAAVCDKGLLRKCIARVVASELQVEPQWGDKDVYWTRRWLYTKSGSHTRRIEDIMFGERLDLPPQPTRREFAEAVEESVVAVGRPEVHAGFSEKEEHGKTRAIYGCDTRSYYTFDYLLRPVEAAWRNKRVLLDPGRNPQSSLYATLKDKPGYRYMLDFDDFNSQHEIWAMQEVIRCACKDAPPEVLSWALESWENMYIHLNAVGDRAATCEKMVGTLPSGHRATTFVNTILNAAYCLYAAGGEAPSIESYHCGDDMVAFGPRSEMDRYVKQICESPFRINPSKQSIGLHVGEFLRVAFTKKLAGGYGARAIASMVSGNWVTENRLDRKSYVETMLRNLWTICCRFGGDKLGTLGVSSLRRRVPELSTYAEALCTHRISWGGSPVNLAEIGTKIRVMRSTGGRARVKEELPRVCHASSDFLHNHIDFSLLEDTGITPGMVKHALRRASVKPRSIGEDRALIYHTDDTADVSSMPFSTAIAQYARADKSYGEAFTVLSQLFSKVHWSSIVSAIHGVTTDSVSVTGLMDWPVCSTYDVPYSDAMAVRKRMSQCINLIISYPVRV
jgi:hypothetical protein